MFSAMLVVSIFAAPGPAEPAKTVSPDDFAAASSAHKIALLDAGHWIPADDPSIARARVLLVSVDANYSEDEREIVRLVELFWRELKAERKTIPAREILDGADRWSKRGKGAKFEEFVTVYTSLRGAGADHTAAMKVLNKRKQKGK